MTSPTALWETWTLAKLWRIRPSELYALSNELEAYWFDRAVSTFGMAVEADLDEVSAKAKDSKKAQQARQRALNRWLDLEQQFRDPVAPTKTMVAAEHKSSTVTSEQDGAVVL